MKKTRFKGHETFYFRDGWLSKALFELNNTNDNNILSDVKFGISKLGVGSNMVKSIKYWLMASKLVEYKNSKLGYQLTDLGRLIANNDVYFEDNLSLWLIHFSISSNYSMATTWNIFWNNFKADSFTSKDLEDYITHYLDNELVPYNQKSLESDITILLQMYSKKLSDDDPEENSICPLSRLSLINKDINGYVKNSIDLEEGHELIPLYIIAMSKDDDDNTNLFNGFIKQSDAEELLNKYMNANRLISNEYFSLLNNKYIKMVSTAGLNMIYFNENLDVLDEIRKYYEGRL
ncbi:MAG: DUF4007 family protein [Beduini sp.]|uniref:DUF4007 family protein n=1 Tax=Beduini sp. TaxID=1922300 RepID=UPI0039908DE3